MEAFINLQWGYSTLGTFYEATNEHALAIGRIVEYVPPPLTIHLLDLHAPGNDIRSLRKPGSRALTLILLHALGMPSNPGNSELPRDHHLNVSDFHLSECPLLERKLKDGVPLRLNQDVKHGK